MKLGQMRQIDNLLEVNVWEYFECKERLEKNREVKNHLWSTVELIQKGICQHCNVLYTFLN